MGTASNEKTNPLPRRLDRAGGVREREALLLDREQHGARHRPDHRRGDRRPSLHPLAPRTLLLVQGREMTPEQALRMIEQERLEMLAEGATEADANMHAPYVLASAYRKLVAARPEEKTILDDEFMAKVRD